MQSLNDWLVRYVDDEDIAGLTIMHVTSWLVQTPTITRGYVATWLYSGMVIIRGYIAAEVI